MTKTPVSLLQELYVKKGITPKYDLVQIKGPVHKPTFKYRVSVGEVYATGSGQSKKKAKHEAAKAILTKLKIAQQKGPFDSHASQAQTCHFCHNRLVWSKFRENGGGKSKKLTKPKAAARMLATLKSQPVFVDDNDGGGAAKKKRQK